MWYGNVPGANRYEIYVQYCGKPFTPECLAATVDHGGKGLVKLSKLMGKKLDPKKNFKLYVVAYQVKDGRAYWLCKTIEGHVVGKLNKKFSNPKTLKLKKKKVTLKKGKTFKVKATVKLFEPRKKMLSKAHAPTLRFASSNRAVATVDKKGKIKAISKGSCLVYVYAKNGYAKAVKVTVK